MSYLTIALTVNIFILAFRALSAIKLRSAKRNCLAVLSKGVCKRSLHFTVNFVNNIKCLGFVMMQYEIGTAFVYVVKESN